MALVDLIKAAEKAINDMVAAQGKRSALRKSGLKPGLMGETRKNFEADVRAQIAEIQTLSAALEGLVDTVKNAEGAVTKLKADAAKDAAALEKLAQAGALPTKIESSAPFVKDMLLATESVRRKLEFAVNEVKSQGTLMRANRNLESVLGSKFKSLADELGDMVADLEEAVKVTVRVGQLVDQDFGR